MSYSNKKGEKHELKTRAIEAYINYNSKYNIDSTELDTFKSFVSEKLKRITKEELLNIEETINNYILEFIRQYFSWSFFVCPLLYLCIHNDS